MHAALEQLKNKLMLRHAAALHYRYAAIHYVSWQTLNRQKVGFMQAAAVHMLMLILGRVFLGLGIGFANQVRIIAFGPTLALHSSPLSSSAYPTLEMLEMLEMLNV